MKTRIMLSTGERTLIIGALKAYDTSSVGDYGRILTDGLAARIGSQPDTADDGPEVAAICHILRRA